MRPPAPSRHKTGIVNDREFRQHLVTLRLERERKEAQAANAVRKPCCSEVREGKEEALRLGPTRRNPKHGGAEMDTDDGWPKAWA